MKKRILPALLALCMTIGLLPGAALAEGEGENIDPITELPKLDTPTFPEWESPWGKDGSIRYVVGKNQGSFDFEFYRYEGDKPDESTDPKEFLNTLRQEHAYQENAYRADYSHGISYGDFLQPNYIAHNSGLNSALIHPAPESGTYYFTVTASGDQTRYADSDPAVCLTPFEYTRPETAVATPIDLVWNEKEPISTVTYPGDPNDVYYIDFTWYYAETEDAEPEYVGELCVYSSTKEFSEEVPDYVLHRGGVGYYYFTAQAASDDITKNMHGEKSAMSGAFHLTTDHAASILSGVTSTDPATIRSEVQRLDRDELRRSMVADPDIIDKLEELEGRIGSTTIDTTNAPTNLPTEGAKVTGALLNNVTGDVKLNVAQPSTNDLVVPETMTHVTMNVKFSMSLDGVETPLKVPVVVTLPVPEGINRNFLHIVHYFSDPSYYVDGKNYEVLAGTDLLFNGDGTFSFVLSSFSDFAMIVNESDENSNETPESPAPSDPPAEPSTPPAEPSTPPAEPSTSPSPEPSTSPSPEPSTPPAEPSTSPSPEPSTSPSPEPSTSPSPEPSTSPEPSESPAPSTPSGGSGGGGSSSSTSYTVTVADTEHGKVTSSHTRASSGTQVTLTVTPDSGYELDTLTATKKNGDTLKLTDKGSGKHTFTMPSAKVEITATFKAVQPDPAPETSPEPETEPDATVSFEDVPENAWYYDAVSYVCANGLMNGTKADKYFSPDENATRAMVITILARMDGVDTSGASPWYAKALEWGIAKGITSGEQPNEYITREQLATMLWRYSGEPASEQSLDDFTDAAAVHSYALTAVRWAVEKGILSGRPDGSLDPRGLATRAEVAAMLTRFHRLAN